MLLQIFESADEAAQALARRIAVTLRDKPAAVLGLPTGRSPVAAYAELRRMHAAGDVDFSRATTFNLDEFAGIDAGHPGSFRRFMEQHLFNGPPEGGPHIEGGPRISEGGPHTRGGPNVSGGVNIDPGRTNFLNGAAADLDAECERYEAAIDAAGGIDLQLLGIGGNGHIGFNEPGDELVARTHRVRLHDITRRDNAALFGGSVDAVPREALSMGMATILRARRIVLIATGERKANCVERTVRGPLTTRLPASFLQTHRNVELFLDRASAARLKSS